MKYVAKETNLTFGKDIKMLSLGTPTDFKNYLDENVNQTWFGLVFCTSEWFDDVTTNITIPCVPDKISQGSNKIDSFFYTLVYNFTTAPSSFVQNLSVPLLVYPQLYSLKTSIDNGILDFQATKKGVELPSKIKPSQSTYPNPPDRLVKTISLVPTVGLFYFALTPMITFVIILTEVVREKEMRLR